MSNTEFLKKRICDLRIEINKEAIKGESLSSDYIVALSRRLDNVLNKWARLMKTNDTEQVS